MVRDQGLSPCPTLTALAQFIQGALLLDQLHLRLPKLCARGLQLRLCPKAWEKGGHRDPTTETSSNPDLNPRPRPREPPTAHRPRRLSPRVSQQLLQARTSSFKVPSSTVCFEAATTPARPTHARSSAGTHGKPFHTPRPAPGTLGYPATHEPRSPGTAHTVCSQQILAVE